MPYYVLKDFVSGLDARRLWETTEVGALIEATNCHVTRGGEVEVRKGFIKQTTLHPGTHGLWVDEDGSITVFGSIGRPALLAPSINYIRCRHPDGTTAMHRVLSQDAFFGKPYIVAEFVDGTTHHFYNGELIYDTGMPIDYEPEEPPPGEEPELPPAFPTGGGRPTAQISLYYGTGGTTPQIKGVYVGRIVITDALENVLTAWASGELREVFTNERIWIADQSQFPMTVDAQNVSASIERIAQLINEYPPVEVDGVMVKFHAAASYNQLTVSADERSTRLNGWRLKFSTTENILADPQSRIATMLGGQDAPPPAPPGDADEQENPEPVPEPFRWSPGRFAMAFRQKMYATSENLLHFSAIDNCLLWTPDATGAGFIDVSNHAKGNQRITALGEYQSYLAAVAHRQIQLWLMDPDPRRNQLVQVIHNTGSSAPRSVVEFGSGEMFYLDRSGIRAISARAVQNIAYMSDAGSKIDALVTSQLSELDELTASRAIGLVEPQDGRLWMIVGDRIYVLSYFPTSKVSAWSVYEPGFSVDYADTTASHVWLRSGDDIYAYGGSTGNEYEAMPVAMQVPFLDFQRPGTTKVWHSLDVALQGDWEIEAVMDPTRPEAMALVGTVSQSTYSYARIAMFGASTHLSLRFTRETSGYARIGAAAIHYQESEAG